MSFIGTLIALISIIGFFLFNIIQLKKQNKQLRYNFFAIYTERYQKIVEKLPVDIYKDNYKLNKNDEAIKYIRSYFDLCYEQYFLNNQELLDPKVWDDWKEGMKYLFSCPAFFDLWRKEYDESKYFEANGFKYFVENELLKNNMKLNK